MKAAEGTRSYPVRRGISRVNGGEGSWAGKIKISIGDKFSPYPWRPSCRQAGFFVCQNATFELIWRQLFYNPKGGWPVAREELMRQLPKDVEKPTEPGIFFIKQYPGSCAIVVLTTELVTCGGEDGKARADEFANRLNKAWNQWFDEK